MQVRRGKPPKHQRRQRKRSTEAFLSGARAKSQCGAVDSQGLHRKSRSVACVAALPYKHVISGDRHGHQIHLVAPYSAIWGSGVHFGC